MHKLWNKQLEKKAECDVGKHNTDDSELLGTESITVQKAMKDWLDNERRFQEENSPTNVFGLVAENLLIGRTDAGGGACLLCFDELQVCSRDGYVVFLGSSVDLKPAHSVEVLLLTGS